MRGSISSQMAMMQGACSTQWLMVGVRVIPERVARVALSVTATKRQGWPLPAEDQPVLLASAFLIGTCAMWISDIVFEIIVRRFKPRGPVVEVAEDDIEALGRVLAEYGIEVRGKDGRP